VWIRRLPCRNIVVRMDTLPFAADPHLAPFVPAAVRELEVFGARVTLALLPSRKRRQDRPGDDRPAFRASPVGRILREEALWSRDGLVVTPNRYPFAAQQRILWPEQARREPDAAMWRAASVWAAAANGTALVNTVGAAASIARAHAHLVPERLPFLDALREKPVPAGLIEVPSGAELAVKDVPFCLLGVRGEAAAIAESLVRLADVRLTAACNVVVSGGAAWLYPRRRETPAPHFPYALGAAEVWGRWCYVDEEPFAAATAGMLEQALVAAGALVL